MNAVATIPAMNWPVVHPQALLLAFACAAALLDLWSDDSRRRPIYWLSLVGVTVVGGMHLARLGDGGSAYGMQGLMVGDALGHLLAATACIATGATLVYAQPYLASRELQKGEFYTLALLSLLGVDVMVSSNHFLVVYIGLEIMSLSLYALVALRRDHPVATEAAIKYFVLGALASGFLLYGLSMLYGATGSLVLENVSDAISRGVANPTVLTFGIVFVVAGLAFKLGAVPFHMWVPDVYHGAPTATTLLIGAAPKLAAFGITIRLLVEGMLGLAADWQPMLLVLAVASLFVGNLAGIVQSNFKRLLAYSTIGQVGFVLLGLGAGVVGGNTDHAANAYSSALFYIVTYVLTTLGTFGTILLLARQGHESDELADLAGLARRSPWIAGLMTLFMFSLAGIPPLVGFYAKLAVLQALVATGQTLHVALAIAAVLLSLLGAYYYLRVVKIMWFDEPAADATPLRVSDGGGALLALNGALVLLFGLRPDGLMSLCRDAIVKTLAS